MIYFFIVIIIIIFCVWCLYKGCDSKTILPTKLNKVKNNKMDEIDKMDDKKMNNISINSYDEYANLKNYQIRKSQNNIKKVIFLLKPDDTNSEQKYLCTTETGIKLTNSVDMNNIFNLHVSDPFTLFSYYRGLNIFSDIDDNLLRNNIKNIIFVDSDNLNDMPKCFELVNNIDESFSLKFVSKSGYMMICKKGNKLMAISEDNIEDNVIAEFILTGVNKPNQMDNFENHTVDNTNEIKQN